MTSPTGEVLGGFFFGHPQPDRFTERHERLAVGVAAQAAIAMDNARLYQRQRTAAVELQRSLLPRIPAAHGLEITSRYLPAAHAAEVGGDWVDVISLSSGRYGLVVGDVMGKGMHAAAVMGQLRTAIRAYAALELPPGQLLRQVNTTAAVLDESEIATCQYAVLDTVNQSLTFANAGHLPPVLRLAGGDVRLLEQHVGPPLGVTDTPYAAHTVEMPAGSVLLPYTDGLVERRTRHIDHQLRHLASQVHDQAFGPTEDAVDRLLSAIVDTGRHNDDIALLAVRQLPAEVPESHTLELTAHAQSSGLARGFARQRLADWGADEAQIDAGIMGRTPASPC